ncbi:hypothetical protein [Lentzea sp. NPDC051838]|uniref:hypothetical protein n=1 Tax=Lentzea sp. NPDC051838 TaxID=3154849 RepID=UPI0034407ABD
MRDFTQPARTTGPGVVTHGPAGAATILVIDPAGEAPHDGIPATWRPLADTVRVVWLRVPAAPSWKSTVDKVLSLHSDDTSTLFDVVTSGPLAADVLDLVRGHSDQVRSVLLVDPEADFPSARVIVRSVASPPLPLGHPDVVSGVVKALSDPTT